MATEFEVVIRATIVIDENTGVADIRELQDVIDGSEVTLNISNVVLGDVDIELYSPEIVEAE